VCLAAGIVVLFVVETILILSRTGGRLMYSLDDAYIHLRVAEQTFHGTYGINLGTPASASSSVIWPFLLVPFTWLGAQDWLPLLLNLAFTLLAAFLIERTMRVGWGRFAPSQWATCGATFALVLALNFVPLAFTGLEHSMQFAVVLAAVLGMVHVAVDGTAPRWLWAVVVILPLVRFEMGLLAFFTVAYVIAVTHTWRPALWMAGALAGVAAFGAFLTSIGLPPIPGSVLVKSKGTKFTGGPIASVKRIVRQSVDLWSDILQPKGRGGPLALVVALILLGLILVLARISWRDRRVWLCALPVPLVLLHISFVGNSESDRYNAYLLAVVASIGAAVAVPLLKAQGRRLALAGGGTLAALTIASFAMFGVQLADIPIFSLSIHEQQYQMHRFVTEELREPVAVNDLGVVSYRNPDQVLDLWGLGSDQARRARAKSAPGWMEKLMADEHVEVALIYTGWFEPHVPTTWIKVATLRVADQGSTGDDEVDFWARNPAAAERVAAAVERFRPSMPDKTTIELHTDALAEAEGR